MKKSLFFQVLSLLTLFSFQFCSSVNKDKILIIYREENRKIIFSLPRDAEIFYSDKLQFQNLNGPETIVNVDEPMFPYKNKSLSECILSLLLLILPIFLVDFVADRKQRWTDYELFHYAFEFCFFGRAGDGK